MVIFILSVVKYYLIALIKICLKDLDIKKNQTI